MKIEIGVSNRHIHLSKESLEVLCGKEYSLNKLKDLKQPNEYASTLKLDIKGPKNIITNVRVLGPVRDYTQVEISKTDAYTLGLNPPVRDSGDLDNSESIILIGPKGELKIKKGCIIATRHIHLTNEDIKKNNLENIKKVKVKISGKKGGILDNVYLKISDDYRLEMHIDTDDANAHLINQGDIGEILIDE